MNTCKSYKQTRAFALVCLLDLLPSREIFHVFLTKDGLISLYSTMAQMAHFSFPYYFTIPKSEFRIPKFALRISEFGIVKYM